MQDLYRRYLDRNRKMLVSVRLIFVSRILIEAFSVQGGQSLELIGLFSSVSRFSLMLGGSYHVQQCIFSLHESINIADTDFV